MIRVVLLIIIFISTETIADDARVVDEETIKSWGYKTVVVDRKQSIKRVFKVPGKSEAYYPRFVLWKECFESIDLVNKRVFSVKEEKRAYTYGYDYRQMIIKDKCIFFITTDVQYFSLEFQPEMLERYKAYLDSHFVS